ncbi:hypothetical protein HDU83_006377 [Entophlyctis luteolus]|nr:hypothetical protein HDU83_006377 [Entophlyctis luteolus]
MPAVPLRPARALALSEQIRALAQSLRLHEPGRIAEYVTYLHPAASLPPLPPPPPPQPAAPASADQPEHFVASASAASAQPSLLPPQLLPPPPPPISASSSGPPASESSPHHRRADRHGEPTSSAVMPNPSVSRSSWKRVREAQSPDDAPSYSQSKRRRSSQSPQPQHTRGSSASNWDSGESDSAITVTTVAAASAVISSSPGPIIQPDMDLEARVDSSESIPATKSYRKSSDTSDQRAVHLTERSSGGSSIRSNTDSANLRLNSSNPAQQPARVQIVERGTGGAAFAVSPKLNSAGKDVAAQNQHSHVQIRRADRIEKVGRDEKRPTDGIVEEKYSKDRGRDSAELSENRDRERAGSDGKKTSQGDSSRSRSRSLERGRTREIGKSGLIAYSNNAGSPDRRPRPRSKDAGSRRQLPGDRRSKSHSPSKSASPPRRVYERNRNFKTPDREQNRGAEHSRDVSSAKRAGNSSSKTSSDRQSQNLSKSPHADTRLNAQRGDESPSSPPLPPPPLPPPAADSSNFSQKVDAKHPETQIPVTAKPVTPSQPVKKVSLLEYSSKLRNSTTASPNTGALPKLEEQSTSAPPQPQTTQIPAAASSVNGSGESITSKLNWKNLVAIHKHKGDEINQKFKVAGPAVSDSDSLIMILNYCTCVFYSLLETGKDDSQIAKTHTHSESLLQFVLKRLSKMKLNEIYSLMQVFVFLLALSERGNKSTLFTRLRLESVLLNRFVRKRLHDSGKKAKSLSAFMNQQLQDAPEKAIEFGGANNGSEFQQQFGLLKDLLQSTLEIDANSRKAEHSWTLADKLCVNLRDAFPSASQESGGFVITLYSEYKELADYGVRCLRDYAERHGVDLQNRQ